MMKPQHVLGALVGATLLFGLGYWSGRSANPSAVPPEFYRSTTESLKVEFSGVAAELRQALLERDLLERTARVGDTLQKLGPESAEQVFDVFETVWLDMGQTELVLLADWWARFDPHAALKWAESDFRTARTKVPMAVMRSWARHDPSAALTRALEGKIGNPTAGREGNPKARIAYEAAAIEGWEDSDKPGVLEYIHGLGPGEHRQRAITGLTLRKVMREGVDAAFRWAGALPDEDKLFKLNVLRRITTSAAKVDPVAASKWVEKYSGTYYMRSLPQRVAIQWARRDPLATMAWLETLESDRNRDEGVREAFRNWNRNDWEAATQWVTSGEHARWKDEALALYSRRLQLRDPEEAMKLAAKIVDDEIRVGTEVIIARTWHSQDEEAATKWVDEESGMTEKEKRRALTYGERWRSGVAGAMERAQEIDERAAQERLDDWSAPGEESQEE